MMVNAFSPVLSDPSGDHWKLQLDLQALNAGAAKKAEQDAQRTVEPTSTAVRSAPAPEAGPAHPSRTSAAPEVAPAAEDAARYL